MAEQRKDGQRNTHDETCMTRNKHESKEKETNLTMKTNSQKSKATVSEDKPELASALPYQGGEL